MTSRTEQLRRWTARVAIALCLIAGWSPLHAQESAPATPEPAGPNSEIRGKVLKPDGSPLAGVEVMGYHLATEEVYRATTDPKGQFSMAELPYGYYDLAVRQGFDVLYEENEQTKRENDRLRKEVGGR